MKKTTLLNKGLVFLLLLLSMSSFAQNLVPFAPRYDEAIKGDILLIGNSNMGVHATNSYSGNSNNESSTNRNRMVYVDTDSEGNTFNSSSADLDVPNDVSCYQIVYAALYWSSVVKGDTPMADIKFKTPESGSYIDISGTEVYYQNSSDDRNSNTYAYYSDVTNILSTLSDIEGTYTVANISSMTSDMMNNGDGRNTEGLSAGWSLFVIYEDPLLPSKYITSFDGFTKIDNQAPNNEQSFGINGFKTIPTGPVRAKYAFSALEGDRGWTQDYLEINGTKISATNASGTTIRPSNNFFNSTVSIIDPSTNSPILFTDRNPVSSNTLGFDAGIINIPNAGNSLIANGDTSANIKLGTNTDIYYFYFSAFAIEIIAPNIVLTKIVEDELGNNIEGQVVDLGDQLYYTIGFQNTGNDDATDLTIRDVLPTNIVFDYPADIGVLPSGVTVQSYNSATRELVFSIDSSVVEENDPVKEIRFKVTVVSTCSLLSDACSNNIDNQAYATYKGTINPDFTISDDPSYNSNTGCLLTPGATNFLADLNDCTFQEEVVLCGDSTVLTAGSGYDAYSWSTSPSGTPVIGDTQSITVTTTGTYYVHNTAVAPCQSTDQVFEVITFGAGVTNPVIPYADQVVTCPNDGKQLPNIFLCGANDSRFIETGISDTSSMIWEKLDESSCTAVVNQDCANEDDACTWNEVETGPDFLVDSAGQYRLTLNYTGGCFNQFYFNVYTNLLEPTVSSEDIICTTPGEITVGGVPSGYEYSLDNVNYQTSNVFSIAIADLYTVYIRQIGVTPNPCIFTVPNVQIRQRDFTGTTNITQPYCNGEMGSVVLAANDVRPQYFFSISQGATLINSVGPIMESDYTFEDLNPGIYTVNISTEDGCTFTGDIEIINPPLLTATSALTTPLGCTDGEITVYPVGGTPPYYYFVNSTTVFQSTPTIEVTTPGVYNITVVDSNNCSAETSITVDQIDDPDFNISSTDILCYNSNTGQIEFNVIDANGYAIEYSIDGGTTYSASSTFSNLDTGVYGANIKYSLDGTECFSDVQEITIIQPDTALTASSGVSELAGCGINGEGKIRITNPQGGTPPYEYSFDNQATWVTTNEAEVMPGTYTLYIRDANGCVYAMPDIILDQEPVAPTITVNDPDFNCDGTASTTVSVNNPGTDSFTYRYLLDGVENPNTADPTTFLNVPEGSHAITVQYELATVPTYSNLLYETFGYGNDTSSPGINPTYYCFERQVVATQCKGNTAINDGDYSVTSKIVKPFGAWISPVDHTPATSPPTADGRFLVVNIGASIPTTEILYEKEINDIIPNQPINVEFYAINLLKTGNGQYDPNLTVALVNASGVEISSFNTGAIPKTEIWENYPKTPMTLDPGTNTSLKFIVRSNVQQTSGNDVAIDDIRVYQLPKVCITEVEFPFVVNSGNAFTAEIIGHSNVSCASATDGTITITAQNFDATNGYQYSINGGANWITQTTSPHTINGLAAASYDVQIRYDDISSGCEYTFNQDITAPDVLEVSTSVLPATCLDGATINVTGTGGTAAYSFELLDEATLNFVSAFPSNSVLTNVATGNYVVRVTDANDCTATSAPLNIISPTPPTAIIQAASDMCYDSGGATLEVLASDGQAPYEYSMNGNPFVTSNVFTNLTPGNYDITVRDANGCTVSIPTETIAEQLLVSMVLTKDLDCTASPDAIITGTITGGYTPYTYEVSVNSGAFVSLGSAITPFIYTTANDGTYQFRVTDARGCVAESGVITINAVANPTATVTSANITCNGSANGSVQIIPAGGNGPYTYSFNGSAFTTTSLYSSLSAGTYNYEVRDSKSCVFNGSVTLTEPTVLDATASVSPFSCSVTNTSQPASIVVTATEGTSPYQYSFSGSGYGATNTFNVNDTGSDQIIAYSVRDANGCIFNDSVTISAANPPEVGTINGSTVTCIATTSTVTLSAAVGTGVGALTYEITEPAASVTSNGTGIFTGLLPGTYTFKVTDTTGCYYTQLYTVNPVINIEVAGLLVNNVNCNGGSDGAVDFTVSNFSGTYSYTINSGTAITGQSSSIINLTGLSVGNQMIEVTDEATGCVDTVTINVTEPTNPLTFTTTSTSAFCSNDESQISVIAAGGTPNYTYTAVVTGNPAPADTAYDSSNVVTVDTNSGTDLVWDVYVKDANGCITIDTVTITSDGLPTINPVAQQCYVGSPLNITLVEGTGTAITPLTYSIGSGFQASPNFVISAPGTYTLTIRDGNGCEATSSYTVSPQLLASAILTKELTCSVPVEATIDVSIFSGVSPYTTYEVSTDGGTTYSPVSPTPVGASFTYSTATAGTYEFRITDTNGCSVVTSAIIITAPVNPVITSVVETQSISCFGESTASIDITIDNTQGLAPFVINVYNDTDSVDYGTQTSGLPAGDYTITVTDANGCMDTDTIEILEPLAINTIFHTVPITCDGSGTYSGSIIIDGVTGGTGPYNYFVTGTNGYSESELNNLGSTSISFNVVDFGLYEILIVDANGCSQLFQDELVASPPSDLDISVSSPPTLCSSGGTAVVEIGGTLTGNGPYHFAIYTGPGMTYTTPTTLPWVDEDTPGSETATFTGLLPGVIYTFIIYDEVTQCYYFETSTIPVPTNSTLTIDAVVENNITCTGGTDGNISFDITSAYPVSTDVTYEIYNSQTLIPTGITGLGTVPASGGGALSVSNFGLLPVGNYFVLIEEAAGATNVGCSVATTAFSITESAHLLNISAAVSKNANCTELGTITARAKDGTAPYEYQAVITGDPIDPSNWGSANTFNLAGSLTYDIYVRDAYGCIQFDTVALPTDDAPTIDPVAQECFVGTSFNITLTGTTFDGVATYSIGGAYQTSDTFTINTPGTYTLSIRDGNGCIASTSYTVEPQLQLVANLTKDLDCDLVTPQGSITLTPTAGVGPYTYEVNYNGGGFVAMGGTSYPAVASGTYEFRVTDSQLCTALSNIITVNPLTTPTLTYSQTNVSCNGGSNGSIVVTASNGIPPYQYSIDNGATFQSSNVFNGLDVAGSPYYVVVRDAKNCPSAATIVNITEPSIVSGLATLTQELTCGTGNTTQAAAVTVTGSGGTGPYSYSFNGGTYTTTNTFTTTVSGSVSVMVRDSNGCLSNAIIENIPALDPPTDLAFISTPVTCLDLTSDVTLTAIGGIGTLTYAILSPASATGNTTGAANGIFTGLLPGTYLFEVTDANDCKYQESYIVDPVTNITVSGLLVNNVSCNAGSDGAVDFTVGNFAGTYSYTVNAGAAVVGQSATVINLTGLPAGDQIIVVTDEITGCTDTFTVSVSEPVALGLVETTNINANCNFDSQVTVTASGGTPAYTYAFVQDGVAPVPTDYTPSASAVLDPSIVNWDVWVQDANGCTDYIDVIIATEPLPTVTVPNFTSNQCDLTGAPYTFTITGSTGTAPLTYSIGTGFQSSGTFTVSGPGTYFVTVRDAFGCESMSPTSVTVYEPLGVTPAITSLPSCLDNDGEITVTAVGGTGNYTYEIVLPIAVGPQATNSFTGLAAGTYTVRVNDTSTSCSTDIDVTLTPPTPVTFTTSTTDVTCNAGSDGTITVNLPASNDNPIYTYEITAPIIVAPQTSNVFTGLSAGTYTVQVNSGRGCIATEDVVVSEAVAITIDAATVVEYACSAGVNTSNYASISVTGVSGGSGNYTNYEFIKGGITLQSGPQNTYIEADFSGGVYTINVYDDNGCLGTTSATILPFTSLETLSVTVDNAITCTNDEDITVSVTSSGPTPTNLEYLVEDIDAAGVQGGLYSDTNTTGIFTGLPIGNYYISVTNLDTNCLLESVHYVNEPNTFDLTIDSVIDVTCFSDSDGSVDVTFIDRVPSPTDESGPFDYSIVDALGNPVNSGTAANAGPVTISGFASGTYTITATLRNSPYCEVSKSFTITAPTAALAIMESHTEITCVSGNNDGTISASATGGWPGGYEYQLELVPGGIITAYSSVSNFRGLTAGTYLVSVRDSRGCVASTNVTLDIPLPIDATVTASTNMLSCFGDSDASITVSNVIGGQGSNYTYTLNMILPTVSSSGPQSSQVFSGLGAGTYNVTVVDGYSCEFTSADIVIDEPAQVEAILVKTSSQTCLTGTTLTLSATGGTGNYEYSDTANFATVIGTLAPSVTFSVPDGTYQYYVRDANGCTANVSNQIKIDPLPNLIVNINAINAIINCAGDTTGAITATAQGGLGSYVYTLQDGTGTDVTPAPIQNTPGVFTDLPAGTYQVQVDSGDCVATSAQITITEPALPLTANFITTDITCPGSNDGQLEILASGGTGIIKYAISPQLNQFFESPIFENLSSGTYQAIAQDELGCFVISDFIIDEPLPVMLSIVPGSILPEICEGDLNGEFSVDITGGSMPYSVVLDDINGAYITGALTQTQFDFTGLSGGDHIVYVLDALGCETEWNISFPESVLIEPEVIVEFGCTNNLSTNIVTVTVGDSTLNPTDLDYSLNGGTYQASNIFIDVPPGLNHYIDVRHSNGCIKTTELFDVEQYDPLQLVLVEGTELNQIVAQTSGGAAPFEYTLNGESKGDTNTFTIYASGDYTVTVTDSNGCTASATKYFEFIDVCIPNYFTPETEGWGPGCTSQYKEMTFDIYDRYGRKIATLRVNETWDGKYNGKELPTGDYWYVVKLNDKNYDREYVGHFTLYR